MDGVQSDERDADLAAEEFAEQCRREFVARDGVFEVEVVDQGDRPPSAAPSAERGDVTSRAGGRGNGIDRGSGRTWVYHRGHRAFTFPLLRLAKRLRGRPLRHQAQLHQQ